MQNIEIWYASSTGNFYDKLPLHATILKLISDGNAITQVITLKTQDVGNGITQISEALIIYNKTATP